MIFRTFQKAYNRLLFMSGLRHPVLSDEAWNNIKRMVVDPPLVRVEEFDGEFYIDPRSHLFSRLVTCGFYEPEIARLITRFTSGDRDAIDIGANIGFFTNLMSKLCKNGRVLACEPTVNAAKLLHRNVNHNKLSNTIIFQGAVSNENGHVELTYVEGNEEYSSLGRIEHRLARTWDKKQITVPARKLDDLVKELDLIPGLIKIDVEGAENLVFQGAIQTLKTHRPIIVSELDDSLLQLKGTSVRDVCDFFASLNYNVVDPYLNKWTHGMLRHTEILAIPREIRVDPSNSIT